MGPNMFGSGRGSDDMLGGFFSFLLIAAAAVFAAGAVCGWLAYRAWSG